MYRIVAKSVTMTPECETSADVFLGCKMSNSMFLMHGIQTMPDGMLVMDDDGELRETYRAELRKPQPGSEWKTIKRAEPAKEMTAKEFRAWLKEIYQDYARDVYTFREASYV